VLFTTDHITTCDTLSGCEKIRDYTNKLKVTHILDWDKEERLDSIRAFASLVV
jgi:hypothetical protein